jgi:hypothetical protein
VAVFPEGDFVAVWDSPEGGDAGLGIVGRLFDADATPLSSEIPINTYTSGNQRRPSVAIADDGTFLVAWDSSNAQDGEGTGVFAQRFARDGARIGTELQVNRFTSGAQEVSQVAAAAEGFVIVWESDLANSNVATINGQRFDTSAQAAGTEFQASSYSEDGQRRPAIAAAPDGGFTVVWDSGGQDGAGRGVFGRRHNSTGATVQGRSRSTLHHRRAARTRTGGRRNGAVVGGLAERCTGWLRFRHLRSALRKRRNTDRHRVSDQHDEHRRPGQPGHRR